MTPHLQNLLAELRAALHSGRPSLRVSELDFYPEAERIEIAEALLGDDEPYRWDRIASWLGFPSAADMVDDVRRRQRLRP